MQTSGHLALASPPSITAVEGKMILQFLDHLESRLHSMRGWPGRFVYRGSGLTVVPEDARACCLASLAHVRDAVALRSSEFFLPISDLQQTHFFALALFHIGGTFLPGSSLVLLLFLGSL